MSPLKKFIKGCITNQLEIENLNTKIFDYYKRTKERGEQEHKTDQKEKIIVRQR